MDGRGRRRAYAQAEFITEPLDKYGEWRLYIRDPEGYLIEDAGVSVPVKRGLDAIAQQHIF